MDLRSKVQPVLTDKEMLLLRVLDMTQELCDVVDKLIVLWEGRVVLPSESQSINNAIQAVAVSYDRYVSEIETLAYDLPGEVVKSSLVEVPK